MDNVKLDLIEITGHHSQLPPFIFIEHHYQKDALDCLLKPPTKSQRKDPHQTAGLTRGEKAWLKRKGR